MNAVEIVMVAVCWFAAGYQARRVRPVRRALAWSVAQRRLPCRWSRRRYRWTAVAVSAVWALGRLVLNPRRTRRAWEAAAVYVWDGHEISKEEQP